MKQGDIRLINPEPTTGAEIKKIRPAIVVNDNALGKLPLKIIVPLTDWKERFGVASWMVHIIPNTVNHLSKESAADCFQVRSISNERFVKKIGHVSIRNLDEVKESLSRVLSIDR